MLQKFVSSLTMRLNYMEHNLVDLLRILANKHGSPCAPALALVPLDSRQPPVPLDSATSLLQDAILWAVPKRRRSREMRMSRKFRPHIILKTKKLLLCLTCGGAHEVGHLCPVCFERVRDVTKVVQEKMSDVFGRNPIDKHVVAHYLGEQRPKVSADCVIIEVPKQRPSFFNKNLLTPSTPANPDSTTVEVVSDTKVIS